MRKPKTILPDPAGAYGFVVFWILLLFSGERALGDGDPFWHIRAGATMLAQGEILTTDVFSHTVFGREWIAHEWLSEVVMALVHDVAGVPGVVVFYFFLAAITFWLLFRLLSRLGGDWLAFLIISLTLPICLSHLLARPHLFSWFFGVLTLDILFRGGRRLFLLIPLTAVWTNFHGGFLLGLTLQFIFIAGSFLDTLSTSERPNLATLWDGQRVRILVLLLSILAVGINPFGYDLLLFPIQVTESIFSTTIGEWVSPDLQGLWHFRLYLLFIIAILFFSNKHLTWTSRLLLLVLVNAALTHARHFSIAALFLTPFFLEALKPWAESWSRKMPFRSSSLPDDLPLSPYSGPVATGVVFCMFLILTWASPQAGRLARTLVPMPEGFSREGIEFLKNQRFSGHLYNEYTWGGYLLYGLDPPPKVFIDGRADMYGKEVFEDYLKIARLEIDPVAKFAEYGVSWVVFPPEQALTRYLRLHPDWREIYRDDQVSVLTGNETILQP